MAEEVVVGDAGNAEPSAAALNADNKNGGMKDKKLSWAKLRRVDSLNLEAGRVSGPTHAHDQSLNKRTLYLAFQALGVIYGDIGTSPLYVFASTFPDGIKDNEDIIGVLSLIIYTILLSPFLKYVFIVLKANDNGNGGTFALYSLICRYARVGLTPNEQPEDRELSNYNLDVPSSSSGRALKVRQKMENSFTIKIMLFLVTMLGCSMVIGDGILTPCISILSAVGGIQSISPSLSQDVVVGISIAILVLLFSCQRFGTDKVGYSFAPAIVLWFTFISGIGVYNLFKHDLGVLRAFNPTYIINYFKRNGKKGFISLGGVVLCITGTEAMFADLGHFNILAVQISFSGLVMPALLATYSGQAAYLRKFPEHVENTFYDSIPDPIYWPTFVIAVVAAIIASQAMISAAFSIITQSLRQDCFPRVKVVHTSAKYEGQVYIPELNYMIMVACIIVTLGFRTTEKIGNAYGIAVVAVMVITTCLVTLIMIVIWKVNVVYAGLFFIVLFTVEVTYLSAILSKFIQGGYFPLAISLVLMSMMTIWHYVHRQRYMFEVNNKVSSDYLRDLAKNNNVNRVPGIGLLYSELVQGIPPIFPHFVNNIQSIHSVIVLVSIKSIPISKVALDERFLFRQVEPKEYRMYRCVVRYGYTDKMEEPKEFEDHLVEQLKEFIRHENFIFENDQEQQAAIQADETQTLAISSSSPHVSSRSIQSFNEAGGAKSSSSSNFMRLGGRTSVEEIEFVQKAKEKGVVYLLGETRVIAKHDSSFFKKFIVNNAYSFLRNNFRQGEKAMKIPHTKLLRVGMTYEI
jgi:KUP system potassium uptake protein